jgi:hypothetical protein
MGKAKVLVAFALEDVGSLFWTPDLVARRIATNVPSDEAFGPQRDIALDRCGAIE